MAFIDLQFCALAAIVFSVIWSIQKVLKSKPAVSNYISKFILLLFSLLVVFSYDGILFLWILITSLFVFTAANRIEKETSRERKKRLTGIAVAVLCAALGITKYFNFFMGAACKITGQSWGHLKIFMPIGISFYTLTAVGYILDVRNDRIRASKSFTDTALTLAFFPKLVCGPIVNARDFLPQLQTGKHINRENFQQGIQIFTIGLFKKVVLADRLAIFVDAVFLRFRIFDSATIWLAVFSYLLQLYFDFSGYSDMAIGISKILGYTLPQNFNLPFTAQNITDFWNRWHISLTGWLTEYVFNPAAMFLRRKASHLPREKRQRTREYRTYLAIVITFMVSGIWHGAGFNYIFWGFLHGLGSVFHAAYVNWIHRNHRNSAGHKPIWLKIFDVMVTFLIVNIIEVVFRAETARQAFQIYTKMFIPHDGVTHMYTWSFVAGAVLLISHISAAVRMGKNGLNRIESDYPMQNLESIKGLTVFFVMLGLIIITGYFGESYFIYGAF